MTGAAIGSPAYKNESIGWQLITTDYVTVILALVLVSARLYTKYFITKTPGWEDGKYLPSHASSPCPGADDACNSHVRYCLASCHRSFDSRLSRYAHVEQFAQSPHTFPSLTHQKACTDTISGDISLPSPRPPLVLSSLFVILHQAKTNPF